MTLIKKDQVNKYRQFYLLNLVVSKNDDITRRWKTFCTEELHNFLLFT
jgi:hypothetical protein